MTDYEALKAYGHSAAMAATIVLDAERGDEYCRKWIAQVRRAHDQIASGRSDFEVPDAALGGRVTGGAV